MPSSLHRAAGGVAVAAILFSSCAPGRSAKPRLPAPGSSSVVSVEKGAVPPLDAALAEQEAREEEARRLAGYDPSDPLLAPAPPHSAGSEWGTRPAGQILPPGPEGGTILIPSTLPTAASSTGSRPVAIPAPEPGVGRPVSSAASTVIAIEKDPRTPAPRSAPPSGPLAAAASLPGSTVVAIVRGQAITRDQLADAAVAWYGGQALDEIITRRLVQQEVDRLGLVTTPAEMEARVLRQVEIGRRELERQYGESLDLETFLGATGETLESYRSRLMANPDFARQYTQEKLVAFSMLTEPRVEVQVIQAETEEQARMLMDRVSRGADFARVAGEHSRDPVSASQGGRMRPFLRGMSRFGSEFDLAAFAIPQDGGLTGPIRTNRGVFVIRRVARSEGRSALHYADLAGEIRTYLESPGVDAQDVLRWLQRLRADNTSAIEVRIP
ncbi:MAG: peptidylprolyl isomerase [Planctomycetes bacterium]|nr:peptidylprolyl isomerase [Planctomycetota bacterium]